MAADWSTQFLLQKKQQQQQRVAAVLLLVLVAVALLVFVLISSDDSVTGCYSSIFSFGDSFTDTGNLNFISSEMHPNCLLPPYGETHFQHPSGRCSDGRLIIDFIAKSLGLPFVNPYLGFKNGSVKHEDMKQGANFAVAGATALDRGFFEGKGFIVGAASNYSLRVQLDWFKELLPSLCNSSSSCKKVLRSSLFIVGEIGGNDYVYPLLSQPHKSEQPRIYIPPVISVITSAIRELIDLGAVTLVVPGSLPLGCNAAFLTKYVTTDEEEYDQGGCLKWLNKYFENHNDLLQIELNRLRVLYPHTNIIYVDYFNAALRLYHSPKRFGFGGNFLKICCGGGGPYNYNTTALCGSSEVIACDDPSQRIGWDGSHLTEAAHRWMAKSLLDGPYTIPKLRLSCIRTSESSGYFINRATI